MSELELSVGVSISHRIATSEAIFLCQPEIVPDISFCALTKLEDLMDVSLLKEIGIPSYLIVQYIAECKQMMALLLRHKIEPRQTRHALRKMLGEGKEKYKEGTTYVPRAQITRDAFARAEVIAEEAKASELGIQHILAALLEIKETCVHKLLTDKGVDIEQLAKEAAALPVPPANGSPGSLAEVATDYLSQFGKDLVQMARDGQIPEAVGRRREMQQVLHTLALTTKNNPVLVGEAGVGKTAIVEGLAYRIADGNIDPTFEHMQIIQLDVSALIAGAQYRGDLEERMRGIVEEASADPNIVLFIDEIHLLIGAGKVGSGPMDVANILKPALSRGTIKLIGATTDAEYHQYIERDAALERRFRPILVSEPTLDEARQILMGARRRLEKHHGVTIRDEAVDAAVNLSMRHMPTRRLPDKAFDLLDSACALARLGAGISYKNKDDSNVRTSKIVSEKLVYDVLSNMLGQTIGPDISEDERILHMAEALGERVIGQREAAEKIAAAIKRSRVGIRPGSRPVGVFLFVGPTGVGKTEMAKATAEFLFGSPRNMIRLDMNEFMEKHTVSRLIGAPPGYVGYGSGGQLTDALHRTPYAVVLLDEVEKAHPDVMNIFLAAFDEGHITDSEGRTVDTSKAIFMMTSNIGFGLGPVQQDDEQIVNMVRMSFRPEMFNRFDDVVIFKPLSQQDMITIVKKRLSTLGKQLTERGLNLVWDDDAVQWLADSGYSPEYGARPLLRLIDKLVIDPISNLFLAKQLSPAFVIEILLRNNTVFVNYNSGDTQ